MQNNGSEPVVFPSGPVLIPASDEHQGYVVPGGSGTTIPPGETRTVPLEEVPAALRDLAERRTLGRVVARVAS